MSKIINDVFPQYKIKGNNTPPRSGAFEVTVNKTLVFSKFDTENFPTKDEIKTWFY